MSRFAVAALRNSSCVISSNCGEGFSLSPLEGERGIPRAAGRSIMRSDGKRHDASLSNKSRGPLNPLSRDFHKIATLDQCELSLPRHPVFSRMGAVLAKRQPSQPPQELGIECRRVDKDCIHSIGINGDKLVAALLE